MSTKRDGRVERVPVNDLRAASRVACDAVSAGAVGITIGITRGDVARVTVVWPPGHSDWVTWESCPRCGDTAAVGWGEAEEFADAIEFDCSSGCRLSIHEFVRSFPPRSEGWTVAAS